MQPMELASMAVTSSSPTLPATQSPFWLMLLDLTAHFGTLSTLARLT